MGPQQQIRPASTPCSWRGGTIRSDEGADRNSTEPSQDAEKEIPVIFLAGPPGVGKSSLGKKACHESGLRFIDLSTPTINEQSFESQQDILTEVINKKCADIIALPWLLQKD